MSKETKNTFNRKQFVKSISVELVDTMRHHSLLYHAGDTSLLIVLPWSHVTPYLSHYSSAENLGPLNGIL